MRFFLDMCIILYYIGEGDSTNLINKSKSFVKNKKSNKFIICKYILEIDIPKWIKRQKIIFRELIRYVNSKGYILYTSDESKELTKRDKTKIQKLIYLYKNSKDKKEFINKMNKIQLYYRLAIDDFILKQIDEMIISPKDIDSELKSHLRSFINIGQSNKNESDTNIIASAIQGHNEKPLIIFTADKKDINDELIEEVHYHTTLPKKYPKLPSVQYLQNYTC